MSSLNKWMGIGNLGGDPEVRYTPSGVAVATFSMATSESWKDKDSGEKQTKTTWHRIVAFGKLAEIIGEYLVKGKKVYIEGPMQTRDWEDREGIKRYTTEIVAKTMIMLSGGGGGQERRYADEDIDRHTQGPGAFDDDIPF